MATHRKKLVEVHARKWEGPGTIAVYHNVKGDQSGKKGDWLVGPDNAEHGEIEVIKDVDFQRDYEPIEDGQVASAINEARIAQEARLGNADGGLPVFEGGSGSLSGHSGTSTDDTTLDENVIGNADGGYDTTGISHQE